jgi:hypothetical protein
MGALTPRKPVPSSSSDIIIIIHLLGLAPAGYLAAPDSGREAGFIFWIVITLGYALGAERQPIR